MTLAAAALLTSVGVLVGVGIPASAATAADAPAWSVVPTSNPPHHSGSVAAVSCVTAQDCTAVGAYVNLQGKTVPLIAQENGGTWTSQAAPVPAGVDNGSLSAVSCTSATFCVAVGQTETLPFTFNAIVETWNGQSWHVSVVLANRFQADLATVSCTSATFCTAVGNYQNNAQGNTAPASVTWNGTSWTEQTMTAPFILYPIKYNRPQAVTCTSATRCVAVFNQSAYLTSRGGPRPLNIPYAAEWNGTLWTSTALPLLRSGFGLANAGLNAVGCPTASTCLMAGGIGGSQLLTFANHLFTRTPSAGSGVLTIISCSSATLCQGVGGSSAGSWNGAKWTLQARSGPPLSGFSCLPDGTCVGVGNVSGQPVAVTKTGSTWQQADIPVPAGLGEAALLFDSCPTSTSCLALGTDLNDQYEATSASLERWDGTSWTSEPAPLWVASSTANSCPTPTECVVLNSPSLDGSNSTVGVFRNGAWSMQDLPFNAPGALDCPTLDRCIAVGTDGAATWDGTTWTSIPTPQGADSISGVDCVTPTACIAVGGSAQGDAYPYASRWNGSTWTTQTMPAGPIGGLSSVACTGDQQCLATGEDVILRDSVGTWTMEGADGQQLGGTYIACSSSTRCVTVSLFTTDSDVWNGTSWSVIPLAAPPGNATAQVGGLSCAPAGPCFLVGAAFSRGRATLIEELP